VSVTDSGGNPVSGVTVTFTVTAGGGSVQSSLGVTDAEGLSSCSAWTLGSTIGITQTLSASIEGAAAVTFSATALRRSADITISMRAPSANGLVGTSFVVAASIASTYQLASVSASGGAGSAALTFGSYSGAPAWKGTLSAAGVPSGPLTVIVTATDVFGGVTDAAVAVRLDRPPVLTVTSPLPLAVARPTLSISAACTDDAPAGCASLTVSARWAMDIDGAGVQLMSGDATLTGDVDLSAFEGQLVDVHFRGADSSGQAVGVTRQVYVESSEKLAVQATAPGTIWDFEGTRILYVDSAGSTPVLRILDTASNTTQDLETSASLVEGSSEYGFLTSAGAIYHHSAGASDPLRAYEWRFSTLPRTSRSPRTQATGTTTSRRTATSCTGRAGPGTPRPATTSSGRGVVSRRS
jgi:hypothetical protein